MTPDDANRLFGPIVHSSEDYEVRAKEDEKGCKVVVLRRKDGQTEIPGGFICGHNWLRLPRREE